MRVSYKHVCYKCVCQCVCVLSACARVCVHLSRRTPEDSAPRLALGWAPSLSLFQCSARPTRFQHRKVSAECPSTNLVQHLDSSNRKVPRPVPHPPPDSFLCSLRLCWPEVSGSWVLTALGMRKSGLIFTHHPPLCHPVYLHNLILLSLFASLTQRPPSSPTPCILYHGAKD